MDIPVYHYDTLDSTNTQCKRLAAEGDKVHTIYFRVKESH